MFPPVSPRDRRDDKGMFTRVFRLNQELSQARAEQAFWSAKDQHLQQEVIIKQQDEAEAAYQKHEAQYATVNAWGLQVEALINDMKEGIMHVDVWSGQGSRNFS
ncbi:hypothetical protein WJX77_012679 [Trebouxia sp. C0004]